MFGYFDCFRQINSFEQIIDFARTCKFFVALTLLAKTFPHEKSFVALTLVSNLLLHLP